jgi:hypothetical protein
MSAFSRSSFDTRPRNISASRSCRSAAERKQEGHITSCSDTTPVHDIRHMARRGAPVPHNQVPVPQASARIIASTLTRTRAATASSIAAVFAAKDSCSDRFSTAARARSFSSVCSTQRPQQRRLACHTSANNCRYSRDARQSMEKVTRDDAPPLRRDARPSHHAARPAVVEFAQCSRSPAAEKERQREDV